MNNRSRHPNPSQSTQPGLSDAATPRHPVYLLLPLSLPVLVSPIVFLIVAISAIPKSSLLPKTFITFSRSQIPPSPQISTSSFRPLLTGFCDVARSSSSRLRCERLEPEVRKLREVFEKTVFVGTVKGG